jgi:hypothetical protein
MKPDGPVFDAAMRARCSISESSRTAVSGMIKAHYIGKWPGVCTLTLCLMRDGVPVGVIVYALPPRETDKRYGGKTWELARLWIADDMPKNTETFLISASVKHIRRKRPDVAHLVSYADPSAGHAGTIYKAANWRYDGKTDEGRKTPRFDYACAKTGRKFSRRKHVPEGTEIVRVPRVSKYRFHYALR